MMGGLLWQPTPVSLNTFTTRRVPLVPLSASTWISRGVHFLQRYSACRKLRRIVSRRSSEPYLHRALGPQSAKGGKVSASKHLAHSDCSEDNRHQTKQSSVVLQSQKNALFDSNFKTTVCGVLLEARNLNRLLPGMWLDGELIDAYLGMLCTPATQSLSMSSSRFDFVTQFLCTKLMEFAEYDKVKAMSRRINWISTHNVLVPIFVESSSHWILAVVRPRTRDVCVYDSLRPTSLSVCISVPLELNALLHYLRLEMSARYDDERVWRYSYVSRSLPQQMNGNDCGVFLLEFSRRLVMNTRRLCAPINIDRVRRRILREIVRGQLDM